MSLRGLSAHLNGNVTHGDFVVVVLFLSAAFFVSVVFF